MTRPLSSASRFHGPPCNVEMHGDLSQGSGSAEGALWAQRRQPGGGEPVCGHGNSPFAQSGNEAEEHSRPLAHFLFRALFKKIHSAIEVPKIEEGTRNKQAANLEAKRLDAVLVKQGLGCIL